MAAPEPKPTPTPWPLTPNQVACATMAAPEPKPTPPPWPLTPNQVARALMALSSSKLHRPTLFAEGAVQSLAALVISLEGLNHHELTLRYAAAALGSLAALPDAQMVLATAGAIPHLVRLARAHDAETQRHAARAIGNLAANASCQHEIGRSGGLRPLVKCARGARGVRAPPRGPLTAHCAPPTIEVPSPLSG